MVLEGQHDTSPVPIETGDIVITPEEQLVFDQQKNEATQPSKAQLDEPDSSQEDTQPPYDYRYVAEPTVDLSVSQNEQIADSNIDMNQLDQIREVGESELDRTQPMIPMTDRRRERIETDEKRKIILEMVGVLEKQLRTGRPIIKMPIHEKGETSSLTVLFNLSREMATHGMREYAFTFVSDSGAEIDRVVFFEWVEHVRVLVHEPDNDELENNVVVDHTETPIELASADLQTFLRQILVMK